MLRQNALRLSLRNPSPPGPRIWSAMQRSCVLTQTSQSALLRVSQRPSTRSPVACSRLPLPRRVASRWATSSTRSRTCVCSASRDPEPLVETFDPEVLTERGETGEHYP